MRMIWAACRFLAVNLPASAEMFKDSLHRALNDQQLHLDLDHLIQGQRVWRTPQLAVRTGLHCGPYLCRLDLL